MKSKINPIKILIEVSGVTTMSPILKIVQPSGILDGVSTNQLRREIIDIIENGANIVLVDFQDVTFINSAALGALVSTLKLVRAAGAELVLCSLTEQVKMMFELTKMNRVFKIVVNRNEFEQKSGEEVSSQQSGV
jgi:anti-anti-sigma factor